MLLLILITIFGGLTLFLAYLL